MSLADPSLSSSPLCVQESGLKNPLYHERNLVNSVLNLFAAGTDTTAVTLQWCLLLMAKYPHFQGAKKTQNKKPQQPALPPGGLSTLVSHEM